VTLALALLAGGVGAVLRALADRALPPRPGGLPRGTLAVNLVGSLALGLLVGADPPPAMLLVLGGGLLGGLTTFSTFAVQTLRLPRGAATVNVLANVLGGLVLATLGLALGQALA
jgi:CrcB protein